MRANPRLRATGRVKGVGKLFRIFLFALLVVAPAVSFAGPPDEGPKPGTFARPAVGSEL